MNAINQGLAWLLTSELAVPLIVGALALWCVAIIVINDRRHHAGTMRALDARIASLADVERAERVDEAHALFAAGFGDIDEAMRKRDGSERLVHAWVEYSQTIVDPGAEALQATVRPEDYFLHLGDETRVLAWWANLFVAMGLTFTFLGIIAALTATTNSMNAAGASPAGMSASLITLLTITAAKFWTSIAGVVASIVLRFVDRRWHSAALKKLARLSDAIERGTVFLPPQRIAADQLRELKQHSVALSEFTSQLAVGIADALGEKMQPLVLGLNGIQSSIDEFKTGSFDQIGKELGDAISRSAGTEMETLALALTGMTVNLQSVNDRLDASGHAASDQIASAAREFSTASERMTRAFATLNDRIDGIGTRMADQIETAATRNGAYVAEERAAYQALADGNRDTMRAMGADMRAASAASTTEMVAAVREAIRTSMAESGIAIQGALDGFAGATAGVQTAFDAMRGQVAELGQVLTGGASAAAERNADVLAKAAAALEAATAQAAAGMGEAVGQAVVRSAEESGRAIAAAFAAFGEKFDGASAGLVGTLRTTAGRMEALSGAIERSTSAAGDHATRMTDAGREAQGVATMLGRAANDVQGAAGPIREATATIQQSVGRSQELLRQAQDQDGRRTAAVQTIATSLEQTNAAAERAWSDYRTRFEDVDTALGSALDRIKGASSEHATALNEQVGRIDGALAQAVDRFAGALDDIKDLANALEDARASTRVG